MRLVCVRMTHPHSRRFGEHRYRAHARGGLPAPEFKCMGEDLLRLSTVRTLSGISEIDSYFVNAPKDRTIFAFLRPDVEWLVVLIRTIITTRLFPMRAVRRCIVPY